MGRFGGDQTDGSNRSCLDTAHGNNKSVRVLECEERHVYHPIDNLRNQRSVSVDSGLQREKIVVYEGRRPQTILESDDVDESESESVQQQRPRRKPKGGAEGDECDSGKGKGTKAKRSGKQDGVGSRIRGRAAIHN